jgi:hypothetical protein
MELRLVKRKSLFPVDSELFAGKEKMLGGLQSVRGQTLAFLKDTRNRDLSAYYWPHPTGSHSLAPIKFDIQNS